MQSLGLIQELSIAVLPIMLAITVHEAAHGLVADKLGDDTARLAGRVTLNPLKHIDPVGTIILPLAMYALSGFMFGWAKPVPVNWRNLGQPRRDTALVAIAGPLANFVMLIFWSLVLTVPVLLSMNEWAGVPLLLMAQYGILINAVLMALNLLPVLPLDGGRVLHSMLPAGIAVVFAKSEPWGLMIMIGLLVSGLLQKILGPAVDILKQLALQIAGILL
jgi:Zn-dependent protease